ncbi:hypothetical protein KCP77_20480 [Salmonella enterica subsp. enterica]|nr:hypothetical protein KCP77_20480 [Salmonella enterica subsp. enterica]
MDRPGYPRTTTDAIERSCVKRCRKGWMNGPSRTSGKTGRRRSARTLSLAGGAVGLPDHGGAV